MDEYRIVDRAGIEVAGRWTTLDEASKTIEELVTPGTAYTVQRRTISEWTAVYHAASG